MKRTSLALAICVIVVLAPGSPACGAQQPGKVPEIGFLDPGPGTSPYFEGFQEGLRELGYVEGATIVLVPQFADGKSDRLPGMASDLVRRKVDPVAGDLVASMAHPGGNITGLSALSSELAGKRLELLKAVVPKLTRVAVLSNPSHAGERLDWKETQTGARRLGVALEYVAVKAPDDFDKAFLNIDRVKNSRNRVDGIFVIPDALTLGQRARIAEYAIKARLPTMAAWSEYTRAGALMSYGPNLRDVYRRTAGFVDRIIKGANPADLPIEQPVKFEFVVSLKTAHALGLTIPESILLQADEVIR